MGSTKRIWVSCHARVTCCRVAGPWGNNKTTKLFKNGRSSWQRQGLSMVSERKITIVCRDCRLCSPRRRGNEERHDSKSSTKTSKHSFQHYLGTKPAVGKDCGPWFAIWLECGEERTPWENSSFLSRCMVCACLWCSLSPAFDYT